MKIFGEVYSLNLAHRLYAFAHIVRGDIKVAQEKYLEAQEEYLIAEGMYKKIMFNRKIDDVSYLYTQLSINSLKVKDDYSAAYYLNEHIYTFGKAHSRTFVILEHLDKSK